MIGGAGRIWTVFFAGEDTAESVMHRAVDKLKDREREGAKAAKARRKAKANRGDTENGTLGHEPSVRVNKGEDGEAVCSQDPTGEQRAGAPSAAV
jgi:hypothetical protein